MRALREQPRLIAAKAAIVVVVLVVAGLVGSALASDGTERPPDLRPRLDRSEQLRRGQTIELDRAAAELEQLRSDLRAATRRSRARARANQRLRRDLRATRRSLARQREQ